MTELTAADRTHLTLNNGKTYIVTKRNTSYVKEPKNAKAVLQVSNWLKAAGIKPGPSSIEGCDLAVKRLGERGELHIKIAAGADDPRPAADHLFVLASELTHRSKAVALTAFHGITQAAGYGKPETLSRGPDPIKKLSFEDNFELVAMRHKEFRKVPNPSAEELKQYEKVVNKAVSRFLYINTKICKRHGIDFDDLRTYAQIWTCNFLGLYKVAKPTNNDNERKLYAHLCQRFGNFVEVLLKKERSCIPDSQTASVAIFGRPYEGGRIGTGRRVWHQEHEADMHEALEAELDAEVNVDLEGLEGLTYDGMDQELAALTDDAAEEAEERQVNDLKRRKEAQATLKAEFSKLTHERLLFLLEEAANNGALCPDARSEARKQLRLHRESCASCLKAQEELAGANALSAA